MVFSMAKKNWWRNKLRWHPQQQERIHSSVMCIGFLNFKSAHGCIVLVIGQQNSPEPAPGPWLSGTLLNLPLHTAAQHSGTFWNPSSTFRNPPEPASRTCSCDPHRHTPELIWAEDPISLRCWGKTGKPWENSIQPICGWCLLLSAPTWTSWPHCRGSAAPSKNPLQA